VFPAGIFRLILVLDEAPAPSLSIVEKLELKMNTQDRLSYRCISAQQAAELILGHRQGNLPALALFDTRDHISYERDHIAGAQFLCDANFSASMLQLPRSTPIVLYCFRGNASQTWAGMFADFRYTEVYSVDGGRDALAYALNQLPAVRVIGPEPSLALRSFLTAHGYSDSRLNETRDYGLSPLMRAAWRGETSLVNELIALGVDVNLRNSDGNTALWLACVANSETCVRALVAAGIDLDNRNDTGATTLMYCASSGKHAMLAILLELGADPLVKNFDDARAVDLCATLECLQLLRHTADLPAV